MKKIFALPILAIGLMASQAGAAACKKDGQDAFCDWGNSCWGIDDQYSGVEKADASNGIIACAVGTCSCTNLLKNCEVNGTMYAGTTNTGEGKKCNGTVIGGTDPNSVLGYCRWGGLTDDCGPVTTAQGQTDCGAANWFTSMDACRGGSSSGGGGTDPGTGGGGSTSGTVCQRNGQDLFCDWGSSCYAIDSQYSSVDKADASKDIVACTAGTCSCENLLRNCEAFGTMYTGNASTNVGAGKRCTGTVVGGTDPNSVLGYCRWNGLTDDCGPVSTEKGKTDCGTANWYNSMDACKSGSSGGGGDPIIVSGRSVGLTVISNGKMLHIISGKAATVELFSMTGAKVFSGKVVAGNSSLSLEKQKQGVYYAVVRSGSQKQTVKVILK